MKEKNRIPAPGEPAVREKLKRLFVKKGVWQLYLLILLPVAVIFIFNYI